jgi:hypothetical protein
MSSLVMVTKKAKSRSPRKLFVIKKDNIPTKKVFTSNMTSPGWSVSDHK